MMNDSKRRYDFGGENMLEAIGGGQLVPSKRAKPDQVALINENQGSLVNTSLVSYNQV